MEFRNDKKIDTTIKYVYYLISVILCLFLILLTNRILSDLGQSATYPNQANLGNKAVTDSHVMKNTLRICPTVRAAA